MLMLADDLLCTMFSMPTVIFTIGGTVAVIAIVAGSITSVTVSRSREKTKREIAAYVAEGSLDPDKAVEMLKAGGAKSDG